MNNKQISGNTLSQYLIIIALISLALIPVFYLFGGTVVGSLQGYLKTYTEANESVTNNTTKPQYDGTKSTINVNAGELGGSSNTPISKCDTNYCSIDFGEFTLNGIPASFQEYTKANGTSGGSTLISELLLQIADQLEKSGDTEGASDYRNLANIGHYIASNQQAIESVVKNIDRTVRIKVNGVSSFSHDYIKVADLKDPLENTSSITPPENIKDLITPNPSRTLYDDALGNIQKARKHLLEVSTNPADDSKLSASFAFVSLYDKIMSNSKYSSNIKGVTEMLYRKMNDVGLPLSNQIYALNFTSVSCSVPYSGDLYDPVTGASSGKLKSMIYTLVDTEGAMYEKSIFLNPNTSVGSNLQSALICVTGENRDTGEVCNKK